MDQRIKLAALVFALCSGVADVTAERSFTLFAEDAGIDEMSSDYFGAKTWAKIRKVNSTKNVYEWDYEILQDLPSNTQSSWVMLERVGGTIRPSSIKGAATLCEDLHSKRATIRAMGYSRSTLPKNCPIKKGLYSLRNHVANAEYFPVVVPGESWRLANTWSIDGKPIFKFHLDVKIDRTKKLQG